MARSKFNLSADDFIPVVEEQRVQPEEKAEKKEAAPVKTEPEKKKADRPAATAARKSKAEKEAAHKAVEKAAEESGPSHRSNFTLTAANYKYLFKTARRGGLSAAGFLNLLLDKCRAGEIDVKKFVDFDFDV